MWVMRLLTQIDYVLTSQIHVFLCVCVIKINAHTYCYCSIIYLITSVLR